MSTKAAQYSRYRIQLGSNVAIKTNNAKNTCNKMTAKGIQNTFFRALHPSVLSIGSGLVAR